MFNVGGGEVFVILVVALIVLGPTKLPEVARTVGKVMGELRRMSSGFQNELRNAMDEPTAKSAPAPKAPAPKAVPPPADEAAPVTRPDALNDDALGEATDARAPGAADSTSGSGEQPADRAG